MENLEFSPISEKQQDSMEVYSFLHSQAQQSKPTPARKKLAAAYKLYHKLSLAMFNRQFQIMQTIKQASALSSFSGKELVGPSNYSQFQITEAVSSMKNAISRLNRKRVEFAFKKILSSVRQKEAYFSRSNIKKLLQKVNNVQYLTQYLAIKEAFAILFKRSKQNPRIKSKAMKNSLEAPSLSRHIERKPKLTKSCHRSPISSVHETRQPKFETDDQQNQLESEHDINQELNFVTNSRDKQQKYISPEIDCFRGNDQLEQTRHKPRGNQIRESKVNSKDRTPAKQIEEQQIYRTKRKNLNRARTSTMEQDNIVQNVIVIRGGSSSRKTEPDKYIKVPITSERVKIIQIRPQPHKKPNPLSDVANQQYPPSSYRSKPGSGRSSRKQSPPPHLGDRSDRHGSGLLHAQGHRCMDCKYCIVLQEMEKYRLSRTARLTPVPRY